MDEPNKVLWIGHTATLRRTGVEERVFVFWIPNFGDLPSSPMAYDDGLSSPVIFFALSAPVLVPSTFRLAFPISVSVSVAIGA